MKAAPRPSRSPKRTSRPAPSRAAHRGTAKPQATVGVRDLKTSLSAYLRKVEAGDSFVVTDRGRAVARLSPPDIPEGILRLMREGKLVWSGRKPDFDRFPLVKLGPGPTLSELLIADRHQD